MFVKCLEAHLALNKHNMCLLFIVVVVAVAVVAFLNIMLLFYCCLENYHKLSGFK